MIFVNYRVMSAVGVDKRTFPGFSGSCLQLVGICLFFIIFIFYICLRSKLTTDKQKIVISGEIDSVFKNKEQKHSTSGDVTSVFPRNSAMRFRDKQGIFRKKTSEVKLNKQQRRVVIEHNYTHTNLCDVKDCTLENCKSNDHINLGKGVNRSGWRDGRRLIELGFLLDNLKHCQSCRLGPVPLTTFNIVGELQKGLGGYLYVVCQNADCNYVNRVPYGKVHHVKSKGMPCFQINTKLGTAMIDSIGGPVRVNNVLSTLNVKPICNKNLMHMESRAGEAIEALAVDSTQQAAKDAFQKEMEDIAAEESLRSKQTMEGPLVDDLGVCPLPDESPSKSFQLNITPGIDSDSDWTDDGSDVDDEDVGRQHNVASPFTPMASTSSSTPVSFRTPGHSVRPTRLLCKKTATTGSSSNKSSARRCLSRKYPCTTRAGMSCAIDTAWQKKGFDSLTSHTFLMSKAKYGKKVVKAVVGHRTCGTCNWWIRNRPNQVIRPHKCVKNHTGSARLMESFSGEKAVLQLAEEGTPVEYLEGDGDNTLIARLRNNQNIQMKKRFDRNHIVKNVGKSLYALHHKKGIKLSKMVIVHLEKCLKYAFARNQGDKDALQSNLKAIVPHQFSDHSFCNESFCVLKRTPGEMYIHKSLPYRRPLTDQTLRHELEQIFDPLVANAEQYADLGSSQQCEHANKEVSLRAPKSHHYGSSKSLDYRVQATTVFINDGRSYIANANEKLGLSPGTHTLSYANKCQKRRLQKQQSQSLPSVKRRRLILKQERASLQGAMEALEGVSYQSGIGHTAEVDIEKLPDAIPRGTFQSVKLIEEPTLIAIDLETTDLIRYSIMPHITQIAATEVVSGNSFSVYVKPKVPIAAEAQRVTGISSTNDGKMFLKGKPVESATISNALKNLFSWLQKFSNVILVAHNGRRFDYPVLTKAVENNNMTETFVQIVPALIDSLAVFKKKYPNQSHKQEDLVRQHLGVEYDAHNAEADVNALGSLLMLCDRSELLSCSFAPKALIKSMQFNCAKNDNIKSLEPLIASGVMKRPTAENIAGSGLNCNHLRLIFERSGEDGLHDSFISKNSDGLPRVTNSKKILEEVIPKLAKFYTAK